MKKKIIALLLTTAMVTGSGTTVVFAAKEGAKTEAAAQDEKTDDEKAEDKKTEDKKESDSKDTDKKDSDSKTADKNDTKETKEELPYAPKEDYDEYALVDYEIESLGQELEIVVSKKEGDKEYNLQMYFFGGDADVDVTYDDDGNCEVTNDGGFFQTEGPLVVEKAEKEGNWKKVADYGKEDAAKGDTKFDVSKLDYQPKADFDKFTVTDFEMESLGQDLEIVVSAMDDEKSFNLQMYFFGGDADINVTIDDAGNYEVTNDSGFFQTEGPLVVQQALEENNWQTIEK